MIYLKLFGFCFILTNFINHVNSQYRQPPPSCTRNLDDAPGRCLTSFECPRLNEEYRELGIKPQLCSYNEEDEPIFCCPNQYASTSTSAVNLGNRADGSRISLQKCQEYSKLAVKKYPYVPLLVNPEVYEFVVPQCEYSTPLIVGGEETKVGEFPHMAAIGWTGNGVADFKCGGSLISERYVLTAAHCLANDNLPDVVRLGEHNLKTNADGADPKDFRIAQVIKHPSYKSSSNYYDVAVLQLDQDVKFGKFIRPACLWQTEQLNYTRAVATGWGRIAYAGEQSDTLLKVVLNVIDNSVCTQYFQPNRKLKNGLQGDQMCAGYIEGGKDTCQGDSGGPLQVSTSGNECIFHIIGVTSFGRFCAGANSPGVYTRVASYLDWIESVVWS